VASASFSGGLTSSDRHGINDYWSVAFEKVRKVEDAHFADRISISVFFG
jgi:hypothetical protein